MVLLLLSLFFFLTFEMFDTFANSSTVSLKVDEFEKDLSKLTKILRWGANFLYESLSRFEGALPSIFDGSQGLVYVNSWKNH